MTTRVDATRDTTLVDNTPSTTSTSPARSPVSARRWASTPPTSGKVKNHPRMGYADRHGRGREGAGRCDVGRTGAGLSRLQRRPLHWVPACAGTTVSSEGALSGDGVAPAAERSHLPAQAPSARRSGAGRNPEPTPAIAPPAQTGTLRPRPRHALHGYRPSPVRRSQAKVLYLATVPPAAERSHPSASSIRSSLPRRPESRTHACHRTTRPDRHPRPRPRHALHWVAAFAGTTVSSEGALSGDRAAPAAERSHLPAQAPSARHSAQAGIQNPRLPSHHPPRQAPAAEAPPCAALGTGLRRYDEASVVALCGACHSTTAGHTKPASKSHPLVIPAQAGIQNPRLPSHHPPRQAPCGRGPAMRCTG